MDTPEEVKKEIGARLVKARKLRGLTPQEICDRVPGLLYSRYKNFEHGRREPDIAMLKAMADALDVSAAWLATLSNDPPDIGPEISRVVSRMRAMEPDQRYKVTLVLDIIDGGALAVPRPIPGAE